MSSTTTSTLSGSLLSYTSSSPPPSPPRAVSPPGLAEMAFGRLSPFARSVEQPTLRQPLLPHDIREESPPLESPPLAERAVLIHSKLSGQARTNTPPKLGGLLADFSPAAPISLPSAAPSVPLVITEDVPETTTSTTPKPSCLSRIKAICRRILNHPIVQITGVAIGIVGAATANAFLDTGVVATGALGVCTAGAAFFARAAISHLPKLEEWTQWALNSSSHFAYHILNISNWMQNPAFTLATYVAASIYTGASLYGMSSSAMKKLLDQTPDQAELQKAWLVLGLEDSRLPPGTTREAFIRFLQDHWKGLVITAAAIIPTVALSVPSVMTAINDTCSPGVANFLNIVAFGGANILAAMPTGYWIASTAYRAHIRNNLLTPNVRSCKAMAAKVIHLICSKSKTLFVTLGVTAALTPTSFSPTGAILFGIIALFGTGLGLGFNQADTEINQLLKDKAQALDLESGEKLANPDGCIALSKSNRKWDALFPFAQDLRQNIGTLILAPSIVGATFIPGVNLPEVVNLILRTVFPAMIIGATAYTLASHQFTEPSSKQKCAKTTCCFQRIMKSFQHGLRNLFENRQYENWCAFNLTGYAAGSFNALGQPVTIGGLGILTSLLIGLGGGSGQAYSNKYHKSIQPNAAYLGLSIGAALGLIRPNPPVVAVI